MLDPLSAASLAAAILQFVDFGSKIIVSSYETYRSVNGTTEENVDLEYLTQALYKFQDQLSTTSKQPAHGDQELQRLAQECSYIAGDLLVLLDNLKVKEKGLVRTWEAIRQSVRLAWKKDKIARKEKLLDSITGQVNSRLLYMIRYVSFHYAKVCASCAMHCWLVVTDIPKVERVICDHGYYTQTSFFKAPRLGTSCVLCLNNPCAC